MHHHRHPVRTALSLITGIAFLASAACGDVIAAVLSNQADDLRLAATYTDTILPQQYGRVTAVQQFTSRQTVILIQDLHCHPEAQRNIAHILENLDANYGLRQVYVEGGYGDIDTSFLCDLQNQAVKKKLVENLVNQGVLTGGEYYSIQAKRPTVLKGLEDEALHKRTLQQLGTLLARRPYFEKQLATMDREIARLQAQYFSRRNNAFTALVERYRNGKIDSTTFYRRLLRAADIINRHPERFNTHGAILPEDYPSLHDFLEVHRLAGSINYRRASRQLQAVLHRLKSTLPYKDYMALSETTGQFSRMDVVARHLGDLAQQQSINLSAFPDLQKYCAYTEKSRTINPLQLLQEEKQLVTEFRLAYSENLPELEISFLTDFCARFRDYLLNRASPDDYAYVTQRFGKFQRLWGQYAVTNILPGMTEDCVLLNQYYAANLQRNDRFLEHISGLDNTAAPRAAVPATSLDEHLKNTELLVLVTGGFHTAGIQDLLRQRQISWVTITPRVTTVSPAATATYEQLAREQARVLSNTLQVGLLAQISVDARIRLELQAIDETDIPAVLEELKRQTGLTGRYKKSDHTITFNNGAVIVLDKNTDGVLHAVQRVAATAVSPAVQHAMTELVNTAKLKYAVATGNVDHIIIDTLRRAAAGNLINGNGLIDTITSDPQLNSRETIQKIQADILATFPASVQRAIARYQRAEFGLADPAKRSAWIPLLLAANLLGRTFTITNAMRSTPPKNKIVIVNKKLRIGTIKACVFDWDGTIADSFRFWKEIEGELIAGYIIAAGYDKKAALAWANDINEKSNGKPVALKRDMVAAGVKNRFPGTVVPSATEFLNARETALMARYMTEKQTWENGEVAVPLLPGILEFLGILRERGIRCLVASGSPQGELEMKAEDMGVTGYFEALHASPAVKAEVLRDLLATGDHPGYRANEVIMFGDAPADMEAAKKAGCIAIGIAKTEEDERSLCAAGADIIIWGGYAGLEDYIFSGEDSSHITYDQPEPPASTREATAYSLHIAEWFTRAAALCLTTCQHVIEGGQNILEHTRISLNHSELPRYANIEIINPEAVRKIERIRLFGFDWDGTLSTAHFSADCGPEARQVAAYIPADIMSKEEALEWGTKFQQKHDGWSLRKKYNALVQELDKFKVTEIPTEEKCYQDRWDALFTLYLEKKQQWEAGMIPGAFLPGVMPLLKHLKAQGIMAVVASGAPQKEVDKKASDLGITDYFSELHGSPETKLDVMRKLMIDKNFSGAEMAFFGDAPYDIQTAKELGGIAIGVAIDQKHRDDLIAADADVILWGDFTNIDKILLPDTTPGQAVAAEPTKIIAHIGTPDDIRHSGEHFARDPGHLHFWIAAAPNRQAAALPAAGFAVDSNGEKAAVRLDISGNTITWYLDYAGKQVSSAALYTAAAQLLAQISGTDTLPGDPVIQGQTRELLQQAGITGNIGFDLAMLIDHTGEAEKIRQDLFAENVKKVPVVSATVFNALPRHKVDTAIRKQLIAGTAMRYTAAEHLLLKIDAENVTAILRGADLYNTAHNVQAVFDWKELMELGISENELRLFLTTTREKGVQVSCITDDKSLREHYLLELGFAHVYAQSETGLVLLGSSLTTGNLQKPVLDIRIPDTLLPEQLPDACAQLPLAQTLMFHSNDIVHLMQRTDDILERSGLASFFTTVLAFGAMEITTPEAAKRLGFNWDVQELPSALTADQLKALSAGDLASDWIDRDTAWYEQAMAFTDEPVRRAFCAALARKICIKEALLSEHKKLAAAYSAGTYRFTDPHAEELLGEAAFRIFCMTPEERAAEQDAGTALRSRVSGNMNTALLNLQKTLSAGHAESGSAAAIMQIILLDIIADYHVRKHTGTAYGTIDARLLTSVLAAA